MEELDPIREYLKAFNMGYTMQQHEPELLKQILTANNKEKLKALKVGQQQYDFE